jgi:hypothetical protein
MKKIRDSLIEGLYIYYFKYGVVLKDGLHTTLRNIRTYGQTGASGNPIPGSTGIQIGEDNKSSCTTITLQDIYVSKYEIGIYNKYAENTMMIHPIVEGCGTGILNSAKGNGIIIQPYFDGNTVIDINSSSHLQVYSNRYFPTGVNVNSNYQAYRQIPHTNVALLCYRANTDQDIRSSEETKIEFNADLYDAYNYYDTSNFIFTAPYSGFYLIYVQASLQNIKANKRLQLHIKVGTTTKAYSYTTVTVSGSYHTIFATAMTWLDAGEKGLSVTIYHDDVDTRNILKGEGNTFMLIKLL